jgi:hypothetical protein
VHARTVARDPDDTTSTTWAARTPLGTEQVGADAVVRLAVARFVGRWVALRRAGERVALADGVLVVGVVGVGRADVVMLVVADDVPEPVAVEVA